KVRGLFDVVDDVVDGGCEREDVLAVERCHVLRVQELDEVARDPVAFVLDCLDVRLRDRGVRKFAEADLGLLRRHECVGAGFCEQLVKLCGARNQAESHEPAACYNRPVRAVTVSAAIALALAAQAGAATRILAVGDFGVGGSTERATGAAIEAWEVNHPARLLLTLGDKDYPESPKQFRSNWRDAFGWLEGAGVWPKGTLGNHDVRADGGRYEFRPLRMPAAHYERSRAGFDLFVLNSNRVGD